jgi:hypothetical protein
MDRKTKALVSKAAAEANRITSALFLALEGKPERDAMSEAISEEIDRLASEECPLARAEFTVYALRSIARDFGVEV